MNRYIHTFIITMISSLLLAACVDSYSGIEQVKTDSTKPEKITVNEVISKSGALEIHFTLPKGNPHIAQVVATYINKQGKKMEFKVSRYSSYILVEGFTGTDEKTVELVCIDNSGNESDVTIVKATPLLSPVELAFETMTVEPAFGGVRVDWKNFEANPFVIHFLAEDTLQVGVATLVEDLNKAIYSTDSVNTFAFVRQFPSIEQKFGFYVSDKWGNKTDTLVASLTPYKEEYIDYNLVKEVTFFNPTRFNGARDWDIWGFNPTTGVQNDGNAHNGNNFIAQTLFNGVIATNNYYAYKFVKNLSDPDPANRIVVHDVYCTFDLNIDVRLSRVISYPRRGAFYQYAGSSVKRFRIWGTDDSNNERWSKFPEGWTLIGEYVGPEAVDPNNLTLEEIEYFENNQEYTISEDNVNPDARPTAPFRYMRLQWMESYNPSSPNYAVNEFEMYGDIIKHH